MPYEALGRGKKCHMLRVDGIVPASAGQVVKCAIDEAIAYYNIK